MFFLLNESLLVGSEDALNLSGQSRTEEDWLSYEQPSSPSCLKTKTQILRNQRWGKARLIIQNYIWEQSMGYNIYPVTTARQKSVRRFVPSKHQLQICTLHTHTLLFPRFQLSFAGLQTNFAYVAQGILTKMQLIISYCTFMKHGFKSKLKHRVITSIPGNLLLMNFNRDVVALSLYLSQRWAMVSIILCVIHCFLKAVPNSYWKNTRRLATGIYTTGTFLFSKKKETTFELHIGTK